MRFTRSRASRPAERSREGERGKWKGGKGKAAAERASLGRRTARVLFLLFLLLLLSSHARSLSTVRTTPLGALLAGWLCRLLFASSSFAGGLVGSGRVESGVEGPLRVRAKAKRRKENKNDDRLCMSQKGQRNFLFYPCMKGKGNIYHFHEISTIYRKDGSKCVDRIC